MKGTDAKSQCLSYFCPVKQLRLAWRLLFFIVYTVRIVAEMWLKNVLHGNSVRRSMHIRRRWANRLLRGVGVRITVVGTPPTEPCILVSNHRTHLDPILIMCDVDAMPVAKAEIGRWPLIGKGAQLGGMLLIERENAHSRADALRQIEAKVGEGFSIILFPEGTTSALSGTLPFKRGVFQTAARAGLAIVPVALIFADPEDFWVNNTESFLRHAGRRFLVDHMHVQVHYGPVLRHTEADWLLHTAQDWVNTQLLKAPGKRESVHS